MGGPEDQIVGQGIADRVSHVLNFCGMCSIAQSALLIESSQLLITHDTGMMHVGAALRKPILSIWGNTIPDFGMYPFYPRDQNIPSQMFEVPNLSCRPCSKIGHKVCPKGHFKCMINQDIGQIATKANKLCSK